MKKFGAIALVFACMAAAPASAQQKKPAAGSQQAPQKSTKTLQGELNALKQQNSELQRQLEEAGIQYRETVDELDRIKATLRENQSGGDSLIKELQQAKAALSRCESRARSLETELAEKNDASATKGGALVQLGPDVVPAVCMNLRQRVPKTKRVSGVVVVNVLVSETGEVLDVRLIQPLPGNETRWTAEAHEACLQAAKRLAFRPATTKDGAVALKVWQGVGFYLN